MQVFASASLHKKKQDRRGCVERESQLDMTSRMFTASMNRMAPAPVLRLLLQMSGPPRPVFLER